ncbi:MAG: hypothetical protein CYPHOPRED_004665 [Cyphobasidiales sp. Tagirdzhanova-0007]|nr:MAG: hypothetical protein CYPHOPRED_004665 [Cyphobasidiales sp. Tagirdzhanova-0007]
MVCLNELPDGIIEEIVLFSILPITSCSEIASLVRSLDISTGLGGASKDQNSQDVADLLKDILRACARLNDLSLDADDAARNHESLYLAAWNAGCFSTFTLSMKQFRHLVLLPAHHLETLTIELGTGGDLQYDYDIMLDSWPNRSVQASEVKLRSLPLPAYSEDVTLGKLAQMCRAIQPPKRLILERCTFSEAILSALLDWAMEKLEVLELNECSICDRRDQRLADFALPLLPELKQFKLKWMKTRIFCSDKAVAVTELAFPRFSDMDGNEG